MLMPDVTAILDDPEVGGGVSFVVERKTLVRTVGTITTNVERFTATGNIQPADKGFNQQSDEDKLNETIVIYSRFTFQIGSHIPSDDSSGMTETDEVLYKNKRYRVTRMDDWSDWGYTRAYATRVRE